jgi:hypothetical protein
MQSARMRILMALALTIAACGSGGSSADGPVTGGPCFVALSGLAYDNSAGCTSCQKTSCDTQFTAAWGSGWKNGDYCSGGSCGAFMKCMAGCNGVATCEDGCKSLATTSCMAAITDTNTCSDSSCKPQCNP